MQRQIFSWSEPEGKQEWMRTILSTAVGSRKQREVGLQDELPAQSVRGQPLVNGLLATAQ